MLPNNDPPSSSTIIKSRDPELLKQDLEQMVRLALDQGARKALLISGKDVVFDPILAEVEEGEDPNNFSEHWPARYPLDSFRDAIKTFRNAIFFSYPIPAGMAHQGQRWIEDPTYRQACLRVASILTVVESDAFYRGYHLAAGYGSGNCRSALCHNESQCKALMSGQKCIHPYKARPSMEAVGIDSQAMGARLGLASTSDQVKLYGLIMVV